MAIKEIHYQSKTFSIFYEILNPKATKEILFLHGWGSNKAVMKQAFSKQFSTFKHIYIDMPGFGQSPNNEILTTKDYANILEIFLKSIGSQKSAIAGHSFGGKVATLLTPDLLILLSSAGIVEPKPLGVRLKITLFKAAKRVGLGSFYKLFASKDIQGMPKNMYETFKNVVDEDFTSIFQNYPNPVLLFWGKSDTATPLRSGEKIAKLIPKSHFYPLEGDHYFFLQPANATTIEQITTKAL